MCKLVWDSDNWLCSEVFPTLVWNLVGRRDQLYRPTCIKQFKDLSKNMVPSFLPESMHKLTDVFWTEQLTKMSKIDGSQEEKEETLPFFQGYLYSASFMVAIQSIFYEVLAQPH